MSWGQEENHTNPLTESASLRNLTDAYKLLFSSPSNSMRKLAAVNIGAVTFLSKIKQQNQLHNI